MYKKNYNCILVIILIAATACVPKKRLLDAQRQISYLQADSARLEADKVALHQKNDLLQGRVNDLLANDADKSSALENTKKILMTQQKRLQQLNNLLESQKAKSEQLRKKMIDALAGFSSDELTVTKRNGKVYISMQENLLFPSASADLNQKGIEALAKLADVLNQNKDITVQVLGHTDSIPIRKKYRDNWQLSTERALSIVRVLTEKYNVAPQNIVAAGHSEYDSVATNETEEGRALNRRTEIILSPNLDELYKIIGQ